MKLDSNGSTAVEMAMVMPFIALLILSTIGISSLCVRGNIVTLFAFRAARAEKVFQGDMAKGDLYAMLTPDFTGEIEVDWYESDGMKRMKNWNFGRARVEIANATSPGNLSVVKLSRESPLTPALPKNLSNLVLNGGDTPSPYCRDGLGYSVCGYDQ